jgi:hypothetical protein
MTWSFSQGFLQLDSRGAVLVDGLDVVTMMDRACEQHVGHPLNTDLHAFLSNQR